VLALYNLLRQLRQEETIKYTDAWEARKSAYRNHSSIKHSSRRKRIKREAQRSAGDAVDGEQVEQEAGLEEEEEDDDDDDRSEDEDCMEGDRLFGDDDVDED
jgi:hypothetical protein